ncbi:MAG: (Fe-S)-binding protein [Planctomycetota bacterium]|jgi:L-lactate dehydrogenase complex protein LldE
MRVALFVPCFVDQLAPEVGFATARLLGRLGHPVHYPEAQTCCGQPALNSGLFDDAECLARRLLDVLSEGEPDAVVCPSGSCVAALRKIGPRHTGLAHPLLDRLYELSEFLVDRLGVEEVGARFPGRVTYHDACHPLRELGIREGPRRLLRAVEGLDLLEMEPPDECCGFGGTFAVKMAEVSAAMGERKVRAIEASGADWVVSTEPSCLMQIDGILRRKRSRVRAVHLASVLAGGDVG